MAKAVVAKGAEKKASSGGISVLAILIITLMSVGAGGFFGMQIPAMTKTGPDKPKVVAPTEPGPPPTSLVRALPPITTNLAHPSTTWIRIESSIVVSADMGPEASVIAARMSEDIIGYLRTVSIEQIEGPSGFQHLREDLNDRVRVRSEGKVLELIIQSLILE